MNEPKKQDYRTAKKTRTHKDKKAIMSGKSNKMNIGMKGGATTFAGTAAGVVIGATVGGLAAAALTDDKTRKAIGQGLSDFAKNASKNVQKLSDKADDIMSATNQIIDTSKSVQKKAAR